MAASQRQSIIQDAAKELLVSKDPADHALDAHSAAVVLVAVRAMPPIETLRRRTLSMWSCLERPPPHADGEAAA